MSNTPRRMSLPRGVDDANEQIKLADEYAKNPDAFVVKYIMKVKNPIDGMWQMLGNEDGIIYWNTREEALDAADADNVMDRFGHVENTGFKIAEMRLKKQQS